MTLINKKEERLYKLHNFLIAKVKERGIHNPNHKSKALSAMGERDIKEDEKELQ